MPSLVESSAQSIADALAPAPSIPSARWRWGTVRSVNDSGTMNVEVGGAVMPSIRCAQHVMGANVGDRVRVMFLGTEAIVDAVRAVNAMASIPTIDGEMDETSKAAWRTALAPDVLYNNATGSNGTITLSQSAANFDHLTIYYRDNDNENSSVDVYAPNGKQVTLATNHPGYDNGNMYIKARSVLISGTSIATASLNRYSQVSVEPGLSRSKVNNIYITRVEAW